MAKLPEGVYRLPSNRYRWRVEHSGRRRSGTEATIQQARRARSQAQLELGGKPVERPTVAELVEIWLLDVNHAHATATVRDMALRQVPVAFTGRTAEEVTGPVVAALWREMAANGVGPHTIIKARNALSRAFEMGVRFGLVNANPIRAVKPPAPPSGEQVQPPAPADVRRLIDHFTGRDPYPTWLRFMAVVGARPGEICGLQWGDLDNVQSVVRIERSIDRAGNVTPGKTGRMGHRDIVVDLPTFTALRRVDRIVGSPWIFTDTGERPWTPDRVTQAISRAVEALEITMRPYDLRHFAATQAISAGVSIPDVAAMLGDNPATVMRVYAHAIPGASRAAAANAAVLDGTA